MRDTIKIKGKWFIPSKSDDKLHGELEFTPDKGIELTIFGDFGIRNSHIEFVNGISNKGEDITVYKLVRINWSFTSSRGFPLTKYRGTVLFNNIAISERKDLKIKKIEASITNLNTWLDFESISIDRSDNRRNIKLDYVLTEDIPIEITDKKKITLKNTYDLGQANQRRSFHIDQKTYISIQYKNKLILEEAILDIGVFKDFLTLISDVPCIHNWIKVYYKKNNSEIISEVYYKTIKIDEKKEKVLNHEMLIPYKLIKNNFKQVLINWYKSHQFLRRSYAEYFATKYFPSKFSSVNFLNLSRCIESFHRVTFNKEKMYFRVRILEVLDKYCIGLMKKGRVFNKEKFASDIVKLRNDATHANPIDEIGNKRAVKEYHYFIKLELFISAAILIYIGIDSKLVKTRLMMNRFIL